MGYYRDGEDLDGWKPLPDIAPDDTVEGWAYRVLAARQGQDSDNGYVEYLEIDRDGARSFAVASYTYGLGNPDGGSIGRMEDFVFGGIDAVLKIHGDHAVEMSPHAPAPSVAP